LRAQHPIRPLLEFGIPPINCVGPCQAGDPALQGPPIKAGGTQIRSESLGSSPPHRHRSAPILARVSVSQSIPSLLNPTRPPKTSSSGTPLDQSKHKQRTPSALTPVLLPHSPTPYPLLDSTPPNYPATILDDPRTEFNPRHILDDHDQPTES